MVTDRSGEIVILEANIILLQLTITCKRLVLNNTVLVIISAIRKGLNNLINVKLMVFTTHNN